MGESTSTRHRVRFSLRQLLVVVALVALAGCWFVWPRERGYWEPMSLHGSYVVPVGSDLEPWGSTSGDRNSRFHIEFEQRGLEIVAVPGGSNGASDPADRRIIWFDGDAVRDADLVDDGPIRIDGEWPLKVFVVTYRHDADDIVEAISVCLNGTIEKPTMVIGAILQANDERYDTPEKLYRFFVERL